ncbi:MAG: hypothetical protein K2I32_07580 [Alistipes sp.]|nr:hypothetical protein [Alistipes sp.]
MAALLGFSAACSSARHSAGRTSGPQEAIGVEVRSDTTHYRVVAMYGVRSPRSGGSKAVPLAPDQSADSLRSAPAPDTTGAPSAE